MISRSSICLAVGIHVDSCPYLGMKIGCLLGSLGWCLEHVCVRWLLFLDIYIYIYSYIHCTLFCVQKVDRSPWFGCDAYVFSQFYLVSAGSMYAHCTIY